MRKSTLSTLAAVVAMLMVLTSTALADDVSNNLDTTVDATAEIMPLVIGGPNGTTQLYVVPRNGDGKNGCNLTGNTTLVANVTSSNTAVATVSPSSVTFTACNTLMALTVTPVGLGSATISLSQLSNNTGGTFNLAPATFIANVAPPPNLPPTIAVAGVTGGASYAKGSVPAATCEVTDAEDGNSSFPATLSAVDGPNAVDGIGAQTASCSYTDGGGLAASASETYGIMDPSAPTIGQTLTPGAPDGNNGWYRSDVSLTWDVADEESPSSLVVTGCENQNVTQNQAEQVYTCSATSVGGSTGPVSIAIKRDASAPAAPTASPDRAPNGAGWYNRDVTVTFSGNGDVGPSGLAGCTAPQDLTASGGVSGHCVDNAGNQSSTTVFDAQIDAIAPSAPAASQSPAANAHGWNNGDVTVSFTANGEDEGGSGTIGCTDDIVVTETGEVEGTCTDAADNVSATTQHLVQIDRIAPTAPTASVSPAPNLEGWNTTDVEVSFAATGDQGGSGIDACTATVSRSTSGTVSGTCTDRAGNRSAAGSVEVKIDKVAPTSQVSGASAGMTYLNEPMITCQTSDTGGSGVDTHATRTIVAGTAPGTWTATCDGAMDRAGNVQAGPSAGVTYTVLSMGGYNRNFDNSGVPRAKAGSVLPLGWAFSNGVNNVQPITRVTITSVAWNNCSGQGEANGEEIAEVAAGSSGLQVLPDGSYQVNWKSGSTLNGCRRVTVKMYTGPNEADLFATRSVNVTFFR